MASKESLQPKLLYATTVAPQTTNNQRLNLVINNEYRFVAIFWKERTEIAEIA